MIQFWDMDHTVMNNDCDVSWKEFLIHRGIAPESDRRLIDVFFQQYLQGRLDVEAFLDFQLREFVGRTPADMRELAEAHFEALAKVHVYPEARRRLAAARAAGERTCLLTATNRIVAEPVSAHLHFDTIVATELELRDGCFTGRIAGQYCCADGKAAKLAEFCTSAGVSPARCAYFGDSTSDIPALQMVGRPVVVNPGRQLREIAATYGWEVATFREAPATGSSGN